MKNDLIITRFKIENVFGTKETVDVKTFFGSKMVCVEDEININNSNIQYSELVDINGSKNNNGYQFYDDIDNKETIFLIKLFDIKNLNHTITMISKTDIDIKNNTQWLINIKWKNILSDYIYYKIKNRRTFKSIKYTEVLNENINIYIRKYIEDNLINRYELKEIKFFVKYFDLQEGDEFKNPNLSYNPVFNIDINKEENLIKNINANIIDDNLNVNYKQTEPSTTKKFDYYFDLIFKRI